MSPRRSSRARVANPLPIGATTTTNSSTSSLSSGRERNTRSHQQPSSQQQPPSQKLVSPHRSNPRSQSLDDADDARYPPRRTRSGHDDVKEPTLPAEDEPEEEEEEEEVTRCVCGNLEYPGLPAPILDEIKQRAKQGGASTPDEIADDGSGIFIQCDVCKVWQHGGCVGILDDNSAPEEYFCEQCRSDLHSVSTTSNGQKFSRYRPVRDEPTPAPSPPPQSTRESARRAKDAGKPRASAEAVIAKRRPTMNSYDEQEQLRRAIEESKREGLLLESENPQGKRSRGPSDEDETPAKRQRTGSNSSFHEQEKSTAMSSSDEALIDMKADLRTSRNTRTREKEKEQKEQKERERQETLAKRKSRSDRRRGEDSDAADDGGAGATSGMSSPPQAPSPQPRSQKKPAKAVVAGKARRGGRTQALRDTLPPSGLQHALDPNDADAFGGRRTRSRSRSRAAESPTPDVNGHSNGVGYAGLFHGANGLLAPGDTGVARPSRPKHMNPNRTSLNEMKKRVAGILEFVTKAQEEATRHHGVNGSTNGNGSSREGTDARSTPAPPATTNGDSPDFATLTSVDMLKALRERLTGWESEFGRWGKAA